MHGYYEAILLPFGAATALAAALGGMLLPGHPVKVIAAALVVSFLAVVACSLMIMPMGVVARVSFMTAVLFAPLVCLAALLGGATRQLINWIGTWHA